jgi:hypothetical protein
MAECKLYSVCCKRSRHLPPERVTATIRVQLGQTTYPGVRGVPEEVKILKRVRRLTAAIGSVVALLLAGGAVWRIGQ